ncbi:proline-rich protein HaeIII subfamily 1-like [Neopsephotus bourkii]|uniref:proline-rich protein HaeIII subfamily 1-like n=1 Tax=Neopsephotus bourkii TaxID=309878 RepID=UPI002AA56ACE|nr:proline-rich protein HaeIII subfamily 1-like [Neopsephotus bourkii]
MHDSAEPSAIRLHHALLHCWRRQSQSRAQLPLPAPRGPVHGKGRCQGGGRALTHRPEPLWGTRPAAGGSASGVAGGGESPVPGREVPAAAPAGTRRYVRGFRNAGGTAPRSRWRDPAAPGPPQRPPSLATAPSSPSGCSSPSFRPEPPQHLPPHPPQLPSPRPARTSRPFSRSPQLSVPSWLRPPRPPLLFPLPGVPRPALPPGLLPRRGAPQPQGRSAARPAL